MSEYSVQELFAPPAAPAVSTPVSGEFVPDLDQYQEFILFSSGGKDSCASALRLLQLGVPPVKIEIHHHLVDGPEDQLMEWPCTRDFTMKFAAAFGMRYVESWRVGGFRREMLRNNSQAAPIAVPMPDGTHLITGGDRSSYNTRMRYPQCSASLSVRWCSSATKIDVSDRYFTTNPRFQDGRKRLVITGERAEESTSRANYEVFEPHRKDNRGGKQVDRYLDHWRAIHGWTEQRVWSTLKEFSVCPHPSYFLGLGRASCRRCVFAGPNQLATLRYLDPEGHVEMADYERKFGVTVHRSETVDERANKGRVLDGAYTKWGKIAMSETFDHPMIVDDWVLPIGAMSGENFGPT